MGDVVDLVPRTPGIRPTKLAPNISTWGLGVQGDGSLVLTIIDQSGQPVFFFLDHSLVEHFENAVAMAAKHAREITQG